jgi:hypothetical protein
MYILSPGVLRRADILTSNPYFCRSIVRQLTWNIAILIIPFKFLRSPTFSLKSSVSRNFICASTLGQPIIAVNSAPFCPSSPPLTGKSVSTPQPALIPLTSEHFASALSANCWNCADTASWSAREMSAGKKANMISVTGDLSTEGGCGVSVRCFVKPCVKNSGKGSVTLSPDLFRGQSHVVYMKAGSSRIGSRLGKLLMLLERLPIEKRPNPRGIFDF